MPKKIIDLKCEYKEESLMKNLNKRMRFVVGAILLAPYFISGLKGAPLPADYSQQKQNALTFLSKIDFFNKGVLQSAVAAKLNEIKGYIAQQVAQTGKNGSVLARLAKNSEENITLDSFFDLLPEELPISIRASIYAQLEEVQKTLASPSLESWLNHVPHGVVRYAVKFPQTLEEAAVGGEVLLPKVTPGVAVVSGPVVKPVAPAKTVSVPKKPLTVSVTKK